ncbi:elongation factor P [Candidatus Saccharibacteria bacterium]|nr:elongation factor P [Candidatus Saccharibacteria bacterium]MCL1963330.1 elongation factor P [Candidatus Saccharibacteria bacterium]
MYSPTDLKKGAVISIDGQPYKVVEYSQKVMGRGGSIVNVKIKNLINGAVLPKTYKGQEKIERAEISNQTAQYLYNDGSDMFFMNPVTFEQFQLPLSEAEDVPKYIKEGQEVQLQFFGERVINVELPTAVTLLVEYTESVVKGDTTSSVQKDAKLETGIIVKVPAFIKEGDVLKIDTRDGSYVERANK